jgi:hypothetical protein
VKRLSIADPSITGIINDAQLKEDVIKLCYCHLIKDGDNHRPIAI